MITMCIKLAGLNVFISYPFFAMLTFALMFDADGKKSLCILASAIHELAHIVAMKVLYNSHIRISLSLFDFCIASDNDIKHTYSSDIIVSCVGPAVNFLLFAVFRLLGVCDTFAYANLLLGVFNMLPLASFDGGRVLCCVLSKRFDLEKSIKICNIIAGIFLVPLFMIGIYVWRSTKYNYSIFVINIYLISLMFFKKN